MVLVYVLYCLSISLLFSDEAFVSCDEIECICVQEAAIEEYFKPLDQEAQRLMKTQLEGEERTMKQMMKTMHDQAMLDIADEERKVKAQIVDTDQKNKDPRPNTQHLPPPT